MQEMQATLTVKQLAEVLQKSPNTVSRWVREGYIPAAMLGGQYRISIADLNVWWQSRGGHMLFDDKHTLRNALLDEVLRLDAELADEHKAQVKARHELLERAREKLEKRYADYMNDLAMPDMGGSE